MDYNDIEILFAEDSADDATLTIRAFNKCGITSKLLHVKDGAEAMDFIYCKGEYASRNINNRLKVIFLDLKMPKVTGMEVLEKVKADPNIKNVPVVILTSTNEPQDIKKCYDLGANSYIVKPLEIDMFYNAIKDLGTYWMKRNQDYEYDHVPTDTSIQHN